jgi:metal transporter CNNM
LVQYGGLFTPEISCLLVIFVGIMSGLTLGLMTLDSVGLEILQRSGSFTEKKKSW